MRHKIENKYLYWGLTAFAVIGASILLYFIMLRFDNIISVIGRILYILKPLFYGVVLAYLLTLLFNSFEKRFIKLLSKRYKDEAKVIKLSKIISIILSILILLLSLTLILYILIPILIDSVLGIIETWTENVDNIENWLENILSFSPALEDMITSAINDSSKSILSWISEGILPRMENIFSSVTTGLNDMYVFIKDFVIGLVFSVYMLANKNKFIAEVKKFIYTILGVKKANTLLAGGRYSYKIFNGFVKGKLLTSLIIGTACYLGMVIFNMPYALLISIIVAITNIIPFFGPIIGWVPGVVLVAMVSPITALYFTVLIIILQQIEGNIIEPKIVGNNTGISGFWVLFAIIVFGDLFGFIGMIIGVPIFAIIYHFVSYYINKKLSNKRMPYKDEDYIDLKYIDETTGRPIKLKNSD